MGALKYWLEAHIFMCTLGPIMILFHTAFKFGGLVAVSFWSMVAVFLSGVAGRFIYIQIPRTIEGQTLSQNELKEMQSDIALTLKSSYNLDEQSYIKISELLTRKGEGFLNNRSVDRRKKHEIRSELRRLKLPGAERRKFMTLVKQDISLNRKIERLDLMENLFKYWHVAHLPFAMVMLIVMLIHVAVTILFGYRWIF